MSRRTAPGHLARPTRDWWRKMVGEYDLDETGERLLTAAGESWDRAAQAREALAEHGTATYDDRFGQPHARPEVAIERDARLAFARLVKALGLDEEP